MTSYAPRRTASPRGPSTVPAETQIHASAAVRAAGGRPVDVKHTGGASRPRPSPHDAEAARRRTSPRRAAAPALPRRSSIKRHYNHAPSFKSRIVTGRRAESGLISRGSAGAVMHLRTPADRHAPGRLKDTSMVTLLSGRSACAGMLLAVVLVAVVLAGTRIIGEDEAGLRDQALRPPLPSGRIIALEARPATRRACCRPAGTSALALALQGRHACR